MQRLPPNTPHLRAAGLGYISDTLMDSSRNSVSEVKSLGRWVEANCSKGHLGGPRPSGLTPRRIRY